MTDQDPRTPTPQETALYEAMTAGDWDTVNQARDTAYAADQAPPDPTPDDWLPPAAQYDADFGYAHQHYQADHEAPETERETATVEHVEAENTEAPDTEPQPTPVEETP